MSHLVCNIHEQRVHVLEHGVVMHRSNATYCPARIVEIDNKAYAAIEVSRKGVGGAEELAVNEKVWAKELAKLPSADFVERITRATEKITEALNNFGEKLRAGNSAAKLVNDVFASQADHVREQQEADDEAYRNFQRRKSIKGITPTAVILDEVPDFNK